MYSIILLKQVEHSIILLKVLWHSQLAITFSPSILEFFLALKHPPASSSIQFHDGFRTGFFWHCSKPIDCRWNGLVAYSWWWWSSRGQTVFFLVETDFLSITHVQTHTSQWTHWLAFCRSRLPQPQMSWSSRLHSHQLKKPRLHQDLLSLDFPVEENAAPRGHFLNCEHFSQVCMHSLQSPVLHQF